MNKFNKLIGFLFLVYGIILFTANYFPKIDRLQATWSAAIIFAVIFFYYSYGGKIKFMIYFPIALFFLSIYFFIGSIYNLSVNSSPKDSLDLLLPTIFVSLSVATFFLFIEDVKNISLMFLTLFFFLSAIVSFLFTSRIFTTAWLNNIVSDSNLLLICAIAAIAVGVRIVYSMKKL